MRTPFMIQIIDYNPERKYTLQVTDTAYRKDDSGNLAARIYRPEGGGPFPLLLDVHGGAWGSGGYADNEVIDTALIIQGTEDANLPLASADQFVKAYRKAKGVADVEWFARMPHNVALKASAETDRAIKVMKAFIAHRLAIT